MQFKTSFTRAKVSIHERELVSLTTCALASPLTCGRSRQHACPPPLPRPCATETRPFVPTNTTIHNRSHIRLQAPTYPDKSTNTYGQNRWTTLVIHPTRPFVSPHSTIRCNPRDHSHCTTRPFALHHTTVRIAPHDCSYRPTRPFVSPYTTIRCNPRDHSYHTTRPYNIRVAPQPLFSLFT